MKLKIADLTRSPEISRSLPRTALFSFFVGLTGCASQAVAKDYAMAPHHIPLRFHDLVGQLAAEMPTSLDRIQTILGATAPLENDNEKWQTYTLQNLLTADGINFASITLMVLKTARDHERRLEKIIVTFDSATCIPMSKVRQEFGMTEYFPWPSSHRLAETYYNPNFSYRFMVTDSRIRANFETE